MECKGGDLVREMLVGLVAAASASILSIDGGDFLSIWEAGGAWTLDPPNLGGDIEGLDKQEHDGEVKRRREKTDERYVYKFPLNPT